ncbi:uncharacterized protein LOC117103392 [Anneissia japonica]|uniref:uncharacterized protein LOC117103392 n=1 Tax=Anneissia japonica TaxID=1529436 RepID=UPI001425562D|nr:uncharacterized protein LOC117103392 [Anneissia japonica]
MPLNSTPKELKTIILQLFPKLVAGGGFEYLKSSNSRKRIVIPLPQGRYCAREIKAYNRHGRVYLRPIQKDLDLSLIDDTSSRVDELLQKCNQCLKFIEQSKLRNHIEICSANSAPANESSIPESITSENYVLYDP